MSLRTWWRDRFGGASSMPAVQNADLTGLSPAEFAALFMLPTYSGISVSPETAIRAIPVQACCSLITGGITSMPLSFYRRTQDGGTFIREEADTHEYWWLFNEQPNEDSTAASFWDAIIPRLLLNSEAFARLVRANGGRSSKIIEVVPIDNKACQKVWEWDPVRKRRRIKQYVVNDEGEYYGVDPADMLHFRGKRSMGTECRSAILDSCREAVGLALAVEQFCGRMFSNGGTPRLALTYPQGIKITDAQKAEIREHWPKFYGGGDNSHLPFVIGGGGKIDKISFTASEAQMLESRKFQVIEIARAFGVPPFMIGEAEKTSSWGSGIEQMSQGFVRYTLGPHITGIEQELNRKLFSQQTYMVDFDEEALARGDMKTLGEWYRQAIGGSQGPGFVSANEVRRRLKMPPKPDGDKLYNPGDQAAKPQKSAEEPAKPAEEPEDA